MISTSQFPPPHSTPGMSHGGSLENLSYEFGSTSITKQSDHDNSVTSLGAPGGGRDRSASSATMSTLTGKSGRRFTSGMNRYSVNAVYSMAAEQDVEVEDELANGEWRPLLSHCRTSLGLTICAR